MLKTIQPIDLNKQAMLAIWAPCTLRRRNWQTVRPAVHTYPSGFSPKTLSKPEEFENVGFAFQCGQKSF